MMKELSRRRLLKVLPCPALLAGTMFTVPAVQAADPKASVVPWPGFPRQDQKLVAEVVGTSHMNEARVRELVKAHPALVNAWWDWGFGDWESPLGAASHVGQRGIAEFLLERGARVDIFAAAMLGWTEVVQGFIKAKPGAQRTLGPHGITLLAHAKAGGKQAAATVAYLESLGDADVGLKLTTLPADRQTGYVGKFISEETGVRLECRVNRNEQLVMEIQSGDARPATLALRYLGEDEFFPSGVPTVRFRFTREQGKAVSLAIRATEPILTAKRVTG
jgi:hypothetical protein